MIRIKILSKDFPIKEHITARHFFFASIWAQKLLFPQKYDNQKFVKYLQFRNKLIYCYTYMLFDVFLYERNTHNEQFYCHNDDRQNIYFFWFVFNIHSALSEHLPL